MNKFARLVVLFLCHATSYAMDVPPETLLDKVTFKITAKQWINTQTALLTVDINATLTNADLVKTRVDIMDKLTKIAVGEWHLIQFDRSQDDSGLEKLYVKAQARVGQGSLTNIYERAKSVSKPGVTYQIGSVEFTPSLEEKQQIQAQLRERLYLLVRDELAQMNKVYVGQKYSVNSLVFIEDDAVPQPKPYQARDAVNMMATGAGAASALTVSNALTMTALVDAASNRQPGG